MDECHYTKPVSTYEEFMAERYWKKNRAMSIHFELTQRCNLRCVHCLFTHESRNELSAREVCTILSNLKDIGVFNLMLSGGELFMRQDIEDILDFLASCRFIVTLYTNGTLLHERLIKKIAGINPASIEVSFYGAAAEVHDAITRVRGSFNRAVNGVHGLTEAGLPVVFKGFLLKNNFFQRKEMIALADAMGILHSFDFNLIPGERGDAGNLSTGLTEEQVLTVYREAGTGELVLRNNVPITGNRPQFPEGGTVVCNPGRINGCIGEQGDVFPCPILRIPLGNLKEKSFSEIWNTDKIDAARYMSLDDLKTCRSCETRPHCNRCPGVAYLETGDYLGPAPRAVCRKYKALRFQLSVEKQNKPRQLESYERK